jgi:isoleucyl-tRNA synthetase
VGSVRELKEKAVNFDEVYKSDKVEELDLHKDKADKIKLKCKKCGKEMQRIPEVIDCWVESASMPFAELHYPFKNEKQFKHRLPAQYIAEYIAQTRTWFYYLHVLSVLLFSENCFENVVSTGTILNEKGEKLSKSKMNYTDPWQIIDQYGADALRFYLMASSVMQSEDLFFKDADVREGYNKVINTLCNVAEFYSTYATETEDIKIHSENVLDKWVLSRLNTAIFDITESMNGYNTIKSCRIIKDFIEELSLWYVRRSRERFKEEEGEDKKQAQAVLKFVLLEFAKVIAPILPYTAEYVFEKVRNKTSVHLENWPAFNKRQINKDLEDKMNEIRKIVSLALAERIVKGIKVKQPLASLKIKNQKSKVKNEEELLNLVKDEINVKEIIFDEKIESEVKLDTNLTEELKEEGFIRDIIRQVQAQRKEQKLIPQDRIFVEIFVPEKEKIIIEKNKESLLKDFRADEIIIKESEEILLKIKKI